MKQYIDRFKYNILPYMVSAIFPASCAICREPATTSHTLCLSCFDNIKFITDPMCNICGTPFEYNDDSGYICTKCLDKTPPFDMARSALIYDDISKSLITSIKYSDRSDLIPLVARMLLQAELDDKLKHIDYIAVVPLHWRRLIKRKYNQSHLLAKAWLKLIDKQYPNDNFTVKYKADILRRTRHTPPQASLNWKERQNNIRNVFAVNEKYIDENNPLCIKGKNILLIDDVMTSGATARACSRILKKAGVKQVCVLTLARRILADWNPHTA